MTQSRRGIVLGAVLLLATLVFYARTVPYDFVWDDPQLITANPAGRGAQPLGQLWSSPLFDAANGGPGKFYRPLVTTGFRWEWAAASGEPWLFHLDNILLHALCATLAFVIALELFGSPWAAFASALLFALHPANSESVAWISGRSDLLATSGLLLACFALLCHFHIALLAAGTFIALLSKETTLLALPALMALCVFRREALGRYRMGSAVAVLALLGAFAIALRIHALGSFLPEDPLTGDQSLAARLARLGVQLTLLSGIDLRALQQVPGEGARLPMIAVALGVAVAAATLFGRLLEQRHLIGAALVAMAGLLLLPTALARLPALRYLHAPLAIASVLLAGALAGLARHWRPRAPYVVGLAFLLPWCALNQLRLPAWTNDARLFATEAALAPGNPDALYFEGSQLMTQGRAADAQKRFAAALELAPNHRPSWLGLTQALLATGRAFAAEDTIRQSLRGEPQTYPQFQLLGDALAQQGNHLAALEAYKQALALAPDARTALLRAARSAQALGRLDEAQRLRKQAGQLE